MMVVTNVADMDALLKSIGNMWARFRKLHYRPTANKAQQWVAQARGREVADEKREGHMRILPDVKTFGETAEEALKKLAQAIESGK